MSDPRSRLRVRQRRAHSRAVSLVEVLVVISILLLLLAMLLPSVNKAREQARRVQCAGNLRQWGVACSMYREANRDFLPTEGTYLHPDKPYTWFNVLPPYLGAPPYREVERTGGLIKDFPELHVWICPSKSRSRLYKSTSGKNQFHYGMNLALDGLDSSNAPSSSDKPALPISARLFRDRPTTVFMFDIYRNDSRGYQPDVADATIFHDDYANVLKLEGSVAGFRARDFVEDGDLQRLIPIWYHPDMYWGHLPKSD